MSKSSANVTLGTMYFPGDEIFGMQQRIHFQMERWR